MIYVHGAVTTSNIFPKYLAAYSPAYRGIAVDLRGYGWRFGEDSHRLHHFAICNGPDRAGRSAEDREACVSRGIDGQHDPPAPGARTSFARKGPCAGLDHRWSHDSRPGSSLNREPSHERRGAQENPVGKFSRRDESAALSAAARPHSHLECAVFCEALIPMSIFNKHRHFMMAEDPEGFRRVLGELLHSLKKYALLCLAPSPITIDTTGRPHRKFNRS